MEEVSTLTRFDRLKEFLNDRNRKVIILLIVGVIASIAIAVWADRTIQSVPKPSSYLLTIAAIANSVLSILGVGFTYGLLERFGILNPIEKDIETLLGELKRETEALFSGLTESNRKASEQYARAMSELTAHDRFQQATVLHGLAGITAVPPNRGEKLETLGSIFLDRLKNAKRGTTVHYMNTFAEDTEDMKLAITEALADGVSVQMLLMHPKDANLDHRHSELPPNYGSLEIFQRKSFVDAAGLCEKCVEQSPSTEKGSWEIKFYRNTANYPIVAVSQNVDGVRQFDEVYTGFYGAYSSERMPYIEWRGGKVPLLNHFMQIFFQKWERNDSLDSHQAIVEFKREWAAEAARS